MKDKIDKFLELLPQLTKDEADLIYSALTRDDENKMAFRLAKKIFEEEASDNKAVK